MHPDLPENRRSGLDMDIWFARQLRVADFEIVKRWIRGWGVRSAIRGVVKGRHLTIATGEPAPAGAPE